MGFLVWRTHTRNYRGTQLTSSVFRELTRFGISLNYTTSWHRQLKTAIYATSICIGWKPFGIRAAFKEDNETIVADLFYGDPLRLSGEFDCYHYKRLANHATSLMSKIRPSPTSRHSKPDTFVFRYKSTCAHFFVREDSVRGQLPYACLNLVTGRDGTGV